MQVLLAVLLIALFIGSILLKRILYSVTLKELKRRARNNDPIARRFHKLAAYGASANLFLLLIAGFSFAALITIGVAWDWWALMLVDLVAIALLWPTKPLKNYGNFVWQIASWLALPLAAVLGWLQPILVRVTRRGGKLQPHMGHSGIYEKADLLEFIAEQNRQLENRIPESDLKIAFHALQFGDKTVGSVMSPRRSVLWVSEDEPVGPLLMDELHGSGHNEFPVVKDQSKKSASPEVTGTLYLTDLIDQAFGGKVRGFMKEGPGTINEDSSLREALATFSKTRQHLLVVVNNFNEAVGVLSFGQLMQEILGEKIIDDYSQPDKYHQEHAKPSASVKA